MHRNKISPELNMAMDLSKKMRENSLDLNIGYSDVLDEWELIIHYSGSIEEIRENIAIVIIELLGGYGIVRIAESMIGNLSDYPQIDYIEKPKKLLFEQTQDIIKSCVNPVLLKPYELKGNGVLIACIDSGIDLYHPLFQRLDKDSCVEVYWDQTLPGNPPRGMYLGSVYYKEEIQKFLKDKIPRTFPSYDGTGHGTAVLGVLVQMAPEADYIVVKMENPSEQGFPRTSQLMLAIDFCVRYAMEQQRPLAINISFGNNYGAHDGNTIMEKYLDYISVVSKNTIVAGTGNDGISGRHYYAKIEYGEKRIAQIYVSPYLKSFNLQIWKFYGDDIDIYIETPNGERIGPLSKRTETMVYAFEQEEIAVWFGSPTPYNSKQEIYLAWVAKSDYITVGLWNIVINGKQMRDGTIDLWLPVKGSTSSEVFFMNSSSENTLVIPSSARSVISVSAYDAGTDTFATFSGRGKNVYENNMLTKPDLTAPGVNIVSAMNGGGYGEFSGTSFAAPFVSGAAALLMEWGIEKGNDFYMYGEKVRASLIKGARRLPFQEKVPSSDVGWGALCIADSIPK